MKTPFNPSMTTITLLKQVHDEVGKHATINLQSVDVTPTQFNFLMILLQSKHKTLPLKELEKALDVAQPTIVGIAKRLEIKKLVKYRKSETDRRVKYISLTQKGEKTIFVNQENMAKTEEILLAPLSEAEKEEFRNLLLKIWDQLKKIT